MSALCLLLLRTPLTMKVENGIKLLKLRRLIVIYPVHAARSSAQCVYSVCLHGLAPRYLSDHIQLVADSNRRCLRSSSSMQLAIRRTRLSTVGDRATAFPVAGCRLWNSLPSDVTSAPTLTVFRNRLNTHLFSRSFPA